MTGNRTSVGTEQASSSWRNTVLQVGLLPTGERVNITNVYVQTDNSTVGFTNTNAISSNGTSTATNIVTGTFNVPTAYNAEFGTIATTDPTTGITTTTMLANVIDTKSSDAAANRAVAVVSSSGTATGTTANADQGTLQQAWSLINITYQTGPTGLPVGFVTTTSDHGSSFGTITNGVATSTSLTNTHAATTANAGSSSPAAATVPDVGDLFNSPDTSATSTTPQVIAIQQAAQGVQLGVLTANQQAANAPGAAAGGNPQQAAAGQRALAGVQPGGQNANAAVQQAVPVNGGAPKGAAENEIPEELEGFDQVIPEKARYVLLDNQAVYIGRYNPETVEVERDINGDRYSANLDDVYRATNKYWWPPKDAAAWDKWFLSHGTPPKKYGSSDGIDAIDRPSFGAGSFNAASDNDISVAQSASLAPALIVMLARTMIWGLIENYVGGRILGIVINAGGSVTVKVLKNQKETLVNLSDELSKKVRNFVKTAANKGDDQAIVAVKKLQGVAPSRVGRAPAPDNYRGRLNADRHAQGRPRLPDDYDAHHRIPQEYVDHPEFRDYDFHQPGNIQGVKGSRADVNTHQLITNEWAEFGRFNPNATRAQIEDFAAQIDARFARHWFQ